MKPLIKIKRSESQPVVLDDGQRFTKCFAPGGDDRDQSPGAVGNKLGAGRQQNDTGNRASIPHGDLAKILVRRDDDVVLAPGDHRNLQIGRPMIGIDRIATVVPRGS